MELKFRTIDPDCLLAVLYKTSPLKMYFADSPRIGQKMRHTIWLEIIEMFVLLYP